MARAREPGRGADRMGYGMGYCGVPSDARVRASAGSFDLYARALILSHGN